MKEPDIRPTDLVYEYPRPGVADAERPLADRSTLGERPRPRCGGVEHQTAFERNGFCNFVFAPVDLGPGRDLNFID